MYQNIASFFVYSVNVNYISLRESPTDFPAITICNLNPFDVSGDPDTGTYINNVLQNNKISPTINLTESGTELAITAVKIAAKILKATVVADKSLNDTSLKKLGFTIESMIISCFYNGIQCSASDFTWFYSFEFGNCYTFNAMYDSSGKKVASKTISKSGPSSGLKLELFTGIPGIKKLHFLFYQVFFFTRNVFLFYRNPRLLYL